MAVAANIVVDGGDLVAGFVEDVYEVLAMVHLGVSVGNGGKVKACHCKTVGCSLILLPVPKVFHNDEPAVFVQALLGVGDDLEYLLFREAVQKLAHPDDIESFRIVRVFEEVSRAGAYPVSARFALDVLPQHIQLAWKVHYGNVYLIVIGNTFH